MHRVLVVDVVGLTPRLLAQAPTLRRLAASGSMAHLRPVFPAVTCPVQASMLTGALPRGHGIVGNGWYFRDLAEVRLWRQSNRLVEGEKIWERLRRRDPAATCAKLFWWFNMYSTADVSVTPRPHYTADGRKVPGIYTRPRELERELETRLGRFPLFSFWGPEAGIASTSWIVRCALEILERFAPTLTLVYLPHLDYDLQRFGPDGPEAERAAREVDGEAARLLDAAERGGVRVVAVSEYGIARVDGPVAINRILREEGLVEVRESLGRDLLDPGASRAFAVSDHQAAHVYVADPRDLGPVKRLLQSVEGIDEVLDEEGKRAVGLDHPRAGELVAVSARNRWFSYYWWLDEARAPEYARTVDIHRKPGYDPAELLYDPRLRWPRLRAARKVLARKLGFRTLIDVVPLSAEGIRGSHGRLPEDPAEGPLVVASPPGVLGEAMAATEVPDLLETLVFEDDPGPWGGR